MFDEMVFEPVPLFAAIAIVMPSYPLALTLIKLKNSVANLAQFQKGILTNLVFAPNVYKRDQSISSNLIFNALGFFGTFLSFSKFEPS